MSHQIYRPSKFLIPSLTHILPQAVALSEGAKGNPLADSIRKTIELFLQRLQTVGPAGGSVATDPIVLSLYQNLNALQPQLLKQIDDIQQERGWVCVWWGER